MDAPIKTIFLVDDDTTNLLVGKSTLSGVYNVFTINSGERLFKMLQKLTPDLILLDIQMPEMGGYDVIKQLKTYPSTADIPVIFLTALNSEETEYEGLSLGAIDYIAKPFSPTLLLKRIELHLLIESQKQELILYNTNLEMIVEEKTHTIVDLKNAILHTMAELMEYRDEITGGHIERTKKYIKILIDAMKDNGVYKSEIDNIDEELVMQSCQLHDVGKIAIKDSILLKTSKLTPDEFEEVKSHTTFGAKVISRIINKTSDSAFLEYARIFAVTHHEKWDGTGYPQGLQGEEIPLLGRLMAIADVYDALVTDRPYKKAFEHKDATKIITDGSGLHFDPALIDTFKNVHHKFEAVSKEVSGINAEGNSL